MLRAANLTGRFKKQKRNAQFQPRPLFYLHKITRIVSKNYKFDIIYLYRVSLT